MKKQSINHSILSVSAVLLLSLLFSYMRLTHPSGNYFSYDNTGYYMYLPALFIYGDIRIDDFSWVEKINEQYKLTPTYYQFDAGDKDNRVIRFFMGMAIMYTPGFAIGHQMALHSDYPADGFSRPYQRAMLFWGLLLQIVGIIFTQKILRRFFSDKITAITLVVLFTGTILYFFYALGNDAPHVYLFTITAITGWLVIKWHEKPKMAYAILLGFFTGLLVISRPSEVTIFFFILLWGVSDKKSFVAKMKMVWQHRTQLVFFALAGLVFLGLQMAYWKVATGNFFFFPYTDAGSALDLTHPRFAWVLFSFRKGLLVYSPLIILSFAGFILLYRKNRQLFWPLFVVFILNLYLIASFSSLISYGYRAFVQGFPLLAIPMGYSLQRLFSGKIWKQLITAFVLLLFIGLTLFQSWQIMMGIIHGSRMTGAYYKAVFLKDHATEEDRKLLLIQRSSTAIDAFTNEADYNRKLLDFYDFEDPAHDPKNRFDTTHAYSGKHSVFMDKDQLYSPLIRKKYHEITDDYYAWIRASVKVFPTSQESADNLYLAISFHYKGQGHKWRSVRSDRLETPLKANEWNTLAIDYLTPEMRSDDEELRVFVWNPNKVQFYMDDFKVEAFERKER